MKTKFLFLIIICTTFAIRTLQAQSLAWVKTNGINSLNDDVKADATAVDASNNVYVLGRFTGTIDFDPTVGIFNLTTSSGAYDIFLQKLDANGNFIWAISLPSTGYSYPSDLKLDASGNAYIAGGFDTQVDFDPSVATNLITPQGWQDAFILKLNANGLFQWVHTFGAVNFSTSAQALAIDNNNDIILSGFYPTTIDFDPGAGVSNLTPAGYADIFILKLDAGGNFIFAKSTSGTDYGDVRDMSVDASNNILITGTFQGIMDFDPSAAVSSLTSNMSEDVFILKLSSIGNYSWVQQFGNTNYESSAGIVSDNVGNIFVAGTFSDSLDISFGGQASTLISNGYNDVIVLKFTPNGNFTWAKKMGGINFDQPSALIIDNNNNLFLTGTFDGLADFDPGASAYNLTSNGFYDVFVSSLDQNGNFRFAKQIGGINDDNGNDLAIANNSLIGVGYFYDTADFDPSAVVYNATANNVSSGDMYTFKWDLCNTSSTSLSAYDCNSYTLNGQTYSSTGSYTQIFQSASGCDSLVTLLLTIGSTNTTINHTECSNNSYTFNGQSYTSAGTYIQYYTNVASCDSNYIINLSFGTPSSSTITDTACDVYFFGQNQILFSTGTYTDVITNANGCDSIITLNLVIHNSVYNTITVNSCGPYTYQGQTYTMPGIYTNYFVSSLGCDSVVDLDLYINSTNYTVINHAACKNYLFNGQTLTTSGNYKDTLLNVFGCDSIISLNLTINNVNTTITQSGNTLSSSATSASYQWINCSTNLAIPGATSQSYIASANGNYAVVVTQNGCTDTSLCKTVVGIGISDISSNELIKAYPNPANNILHVEVDPLWNNFTVCIQSLSGQTLYNRNNINVNKLDIPLSDWAKGMYFLTISNEGRKWITKITKE